MNDSGLKLWHMSKAAVLTEVEFTYNSFPGFLEFTRSSLSYYMVGYDAQAALRKENPFDDVAEGLWYTDAIKWAAANKIIAGYGKGKFGPDDNITREQLAAILRNYSIYSGIDVSVGAIADILSFADELDVSEWAVPSIK
jgi:hypothetical protein